MSSVFLRTRALIDLAAMGAVRAKNFEMRKDEKMELDQDFKPVTYETEWLADDEADEEELEEILSDDVRLL